MESGYDLNDMALIACESELDIQTPHRRPNSWKWQHYVQYDAAKIKCKRCASFFSAKTGADALKRHQQKHEEDGNYSPRVSLKFLHKSTSLDFYDCIANFILNGCHPFSMADDPYFQLVLKSLRPDIDIPNSHYLKSQCSEKFEQLESMVNNFLIEIDAKFSFTVTLVNTLDDSTYMAVSLHFIDDNFELKNLMVDVIYLPFPESSDELRNKLMAIIDRLHVRDRFIGFTTESDNVFVQASTQLAERIKSETVSNHQICLCNVLHQCIETSFEIVDALVNKYRSLIASLVDCPKRKLKLKELCSEYGCDYCKPCIERKRWDSKLRMFDSIAKMKPALSMLGQIDGEFHDKLPTDVEWEMAQDLIKFLDPFGEITDEMRASSYPTINLIIPNIMILKQHINEFTSNYPSVMEFVNCVKEKFENSEVILFTDNAILAAALDPRFKVNFLRNNAKFQDFEMVFAKYSNRFISSNSVERSSDMCESFTAKKFKYFQTSTSIDEFEEFNKSAPESCEICPLEWWKLNQKRFPKLSRFVRAIYSLPASTIRTDEISPSNINNIIKAKIGSKRNTVRTLMLYKCFYEFCNRDNKDQ